MGAENMKNPDRRLLAVGDIHGHREKLSRLLELVAPTGQDQVVFLGDYIDRGPQSREVIEELLAFRQRFPQTVFLRGNHEQILLDALVEEGKTATCRQDGFPDWRLRDRS
jgi:serine/threonine protein phosphatase 1